MAKVYIVQENPKRNVLGAAKFGELEVILPPREQIVFATAPTVRLMRKKLENYCDDDYLIAMGDPIAIAIAAMVASDINQGKVNILKYDREQLCYYPVKIDMYNKRKEKEDDKNWKSLDFWRSN